MRYEPYDYQRRAAAFIEERPYCGLFLDMGLGKSVITLSAVRRLIDHGEVERVLVVAPRTVAETTWATEAAKWDHTRSLRVVSLTGDEMSRVAAMKTPADVYVTTRDIFPRLVSRHGGELPFDMLVLDELTSFKSPKSLRFKAMRRARPHLRRVVGLTGTPSPNGLLDLWAQIWCLDMGERLGAYVTHFRLEYFDEYRVNGIPVRCTPKKGSEERIRGRIADLCLCMQARDYLTLPPLRVVDVAVPLSPGIRRLYDSFERRKVLELLEGDPGRTVLAGSAAALMNKLSQFANGAVYVADGLVEKVHDGKVDALTDIVESAGSPVLVFYQYRHDIPRIRHALRTFRVGEYEGAETLRGWNSGEYDVLLAHPSSTAYGLNMQAGGHYIVWFGTGWNLEHYQQANARLHRQGQTHPVTVYRLLTEGTVDERAAAALDGKRDAQQGMLDALTQLIERHNGKGQGIQTADRQDTLASSPE